MTTEEVLCVPTDLLERLPKTRRLATLRNALQHIDAGAFGSLVARSAEGRQWVAYVGEVPLGACGDLRKILTTEVRAALAEVLS